MTSSEGFRFYTGLEGLVSMKRNVRIYFMVMVLLVLPASLWAQEGKVVAVPQGDTLVVLQKGKRQTLRLANIDCPENGQPRSEAAKDFTSRMVYGKTVKIWPAGSGADGNEAVFVFYKDKNLNKELVAEGLAWHYKAHARDPGFVSLEMKARAWKKGLWQEKNPVPPWEYRRRHMSGNPN
jgi:endonuclease YncB( thermonuclease family)